MVRCFVAVELGGETGETLEKLQAEAKRLEIDATFPREFHCTLAFLGELYEDQVEKTKETLEKLTVEKTVVKVSGVGFFPNPNFIRVFWVGIEGLDELQAKVAKALNHKEKFSAHVTLARIKSRRNVERLNELAKAHETEEFGTATVSEIILFKSTLTPQGPRYEKLFVKKLC